MKKPLIYICSPHRGCTARDTKIVNRYCRFAYEQGGIPFVPHLFFSQFLDDSIKDERDVGTIMGMVMLMMCDELWLFGMPTDAMALEVGAALRMRKHVRCFDVHCREVLLHE